MEKPLIKDKSILSYVDFLESKLEKFETSPYRNSYLSLLYQIEQWNTQLSENPINLFADKEAKEFDRAHKYFTEQKPYFEQLEYLRKLMTPEQQKELAEIQKTKNIGIAEKIALNGKSGN